MHCSDIVTFLVEKRVEKAADNFKNAEEEGEGDSSNEQEDINEEENKGELKDLIDQDLDTDEGDLDWDEQSLEDTGAIDFTDSNDPSSKDEVMQLRASLEKMYTCQPQQYSQLIGTVGVQQQTSIQTAMEKQDRWIADFKNKVQEVLDNHTDGNGNVQVEFN